MIYKLDFEKQAMSLILDAVMEEEEEKLLKTVDQLEEKRGQTRRKLKRTSRPEYNNREVTSDMSKLLLINYISTYPKERCNFKPFVFCSQD